MPRIAGHRMRFFRRNWKRMYPEQAKQLHERVRRQLLWGTAARAAVVVALLVGLFFWLRWGLR